MRISIITDAWHPQPNGVVRVYDALIRKLRQTGHTVQLIEPSAFTCMPCPAYPQMPIALFPERRLARMIEEFEPDAIHIATEKPLGFAARSLCLKRGWRFTTAYHTKFPEYIALRVPVSVSLLHDVAKWFHAPSSAVMCPSASVYNELAERAFPNIRPWSHGVDVDVFRPRPKTALSHLPRPIFMYVGRITREKNLPAFLKLRLPGSKVLVGTGQMRPVLEDQFPDAHFLTAETDDDLSRYFATADVFVFPSLTDTFGLVMLEAMASGVPVAAFPVPGPNDVIGDSGAGVLDFDLAAAALKALDIDPEVPRAYAETFSWDRVMAEFIGALARMPKRAIA